MESVILYCSLLIIAALSTPVPSKRDGQGGVFYDQRQEGEWNIRADLKNFVILIVPQLSPPRPTLLDFLSKSLPKKNKFNLQRNKNKEPAGTQHFIEAKTAPYHVDISSMRDHLAKLHPAEEVVVAKSPAIALVKRADDNKSVIVDSGGDETAIVVDELKLLGAENEQCGPGWARDSHGVCRATQN